MPTAGIRLDSMKGRCLELLRARIDAQFGDISDETLRNMEGRIKRVVADLEATEANAADDESGPIQAIVSGGLNP